MTGVASHPGSSADQSLWYALSDPTRRLLLDRLRSGSLSTLQLTVGAGMTRFGVAKHLGVLEQAGLVVSRKHGRVRRFHLNAAQADSLDRLLSPRARAWADAARQFNDATKEAVMTDPLPVHRMGAIDFALNWTAPVSRARAWAHFFDAPDTWWPQDFRVLGPQGRMSFSPVLGGQLVEQGDTGAGLVWYTVFARQPEESVDLHGQLATRYGGPATSLVNVVFADLNEGECSISLTESVFGRLGPNMESSIRDGWQAILGDGFVGSLKR